MGSASTRAPSGLRRSQTLPRNSSRGSRSSRVRAPPFTAPTPSAASSTRFPPFIGDTLDSGYKNLSGTAAASTKIAGVDVGALYWLSTGSTDYANGNYNSDFTEFVSFTPLSERFRNSALAVHAIGDLTGIWHARLALSRIVDDLRQSQVDAFSQVPAGDFDHTSRDTADLQNDVKIAGAHGDHLITFGAIVTREQTNSLSFWLPYTSGTHTQTYYVQDQLEAEPNPPLPARRDQPPHHYP